MNPLPRVMNVEREHHMVMNVERENHMEASRVVKPTRGQYILHEEIQRLVEQIET